MERELIKHFSGLASLFGAKVCVEGIETQGMRDILQQFNGTFGDTDFSMSEVSRDTTTRSLWNLKSFGTGLRTTAITTEVECAGHSAFGTSPGVVQRALLTALRAEVEIIDRSASASPVARNTRSVNRLCIIGQSDDTEIVFCRVDDSDDRHNKQCNYKQYPDYDCNSREEINVGFSCAHGDSIIDAVQYTRQYNRKNHVERTSALFFCDAGVFCSAIEESHEDSEACVSGYSCKHTDDSSTKAVAEDITYVLECCKSQ